MLQSKLFTKTRKEVPADETSKNAKLLIRAGFINKEMAGVYDYLPLGLRVFKKIENIIREEMNALGGQEVTMSALQRKELWEKTDRWDDQKIDNWFKTSLKEGGELGLGFTHEEPVTQMMEQFLPSYKDLPTSLYQFQTKFRNEARAKSGIMRTREFVMKDLYSFHTDEKDLNQFYEKAKEAYQAIFKRVGLGDVTYVTFASGGSFSKYSHEFQAVTDAGEDVIYVDEKSNVAVNKEVFTDEVLGDLGLSKENLVEKKAVEVGNIFKLMTKFSEPLLTRFTDETGEKKAPVMGCYGIGLGRLMGTIVEVLSDDKGIIWPKEVAPFRIHLISLGSMDGKAFSEAKSLYDELIKKNIEVLFDDRDLRAGEKFADSDLIGIPTRVVISEKTLAEGKFEIKERNSDKTQLLTKEELFSHLHSVTQ